MKSQIEGSRANSKNAEYPDEVADKRAAEALLRALTTPYKPQSEMRLGKKKKKKAAKKRPK